MSKKKSSTMTLRDFHGGSIPSDLPLPSAPGMTVERRNHDRPGSGGWMGSSMNRGYSGERAGVARQGSAASVRSYEEKVSYMPNPANIGRNYDEDERKPVYGHTGRAEGVNFSDEQLHDQRCVGDERVPERYTLDNRGSYTPGKYTDTRATRPGQDVLLSIPLNPQSENYSRRSPYPQESLSAHSVTFQDQLQSQPLSSGSYSTSYIDPVLPWRQNSFDHEPGNVIGSSPGLQNVWTARRESDNSNAYPSEYSTNESGSDGRARISQASALEKVSSGRLNAHFSPATNEPSQVFTDDYGKSFASPHEGSGHLYARSSADFERASFNDGPRNALSRASYVESCRGINAPPFRDTRFELEKANLHDLRREPVGEGRGVESGRSVDDRYGYSETDWRGTTGSRDATRYAGTVDNVYLDGGHSRGPKDAAGMTGKDVLHTDARTKSPSNPAWMGPDPSPRSAGKNANLQTYRDGGGVVDGKQRLMSFEGQRGSQFDTPYQSYGKEEGQIPARHLNKEMVHYVPEPGRGGPESARGRYNDRGSIGPEVQESQAANMQETGGSVHTQYEEKVETPLSRSAGGMGHGSITAGAATGGDGGRSEEPITSERPKLSLKPRSHPADGMPLDGGSVKERISVFGGARPRELVLKERGVVESLIFGTDIVPTPGALSVSTPVGGNRPSSGGLNYSEKKQEKQEEKKLEGRAADKHEKPMVTSIGRQESGRLERNESRSRKDFVDFERKGRYHQEKTDLDRPDVDKQDSWRRPVEVQQSPMVPSPGGRAIHSAVELAQAFSRTPSFGSSQAKSAPGYVGKRAQPMARSPGAGFVDPRNDVPFSRLTEAPSPLPRDYQGGYRGMNAFE